MFLFRDKTDIARNWWDDLYARVVEEGFFVRSLSDVFIDSKEIS